MKPTLKTIELDQSGHVLVATIHHPTSEVNAVDGVLHHDLYRLFEYLKGNREARAILLQARGRAFSAGGDLNWFPSLRQAGALESLLAEARSIVYDLLDVRQPIVCAVGGPAVGLGASIALLSDILILSNDGSLADPHVRVGLVAGDGGTVAWPLAIGPMLAKRFLLTGDPVDADEAHRLGLAAEVVDPSDLNGAGMRWAQRLADGAPLAIQETKQAINQWIKSVAATSFEYAANAEIATFETADHAEALSAWREKRRPVFRGD